MTGRKAIVANVSTVWAMCESEARIWQLFQSLLTPGFYFSCKTEMYHFEFIEILRINGYET